MEKEQEEEAAARLLANPPVENKPLRKRRRGAAVGLPPVHAPEDPVTSSTVRKGRGKKKSVGNPFLSKGQLWDDPEPYNADVAPTGSPNGNDPRKESREMYALLNVLVFTVEPSIAAATSSPPGYSSSSYSSSN